MPGELECVLCGEEKIPEGETKKGRFFCTCGKEWILEKRKSQRLSGLWSGNASEAKTQLILDSLSLFNSTLDIRELIDDFSDLLHRKMQYRNIGILLMDLDRSKIELASYKSTHTKYRRLIRKIDLDYDMSLGVLVKSMTESRSIYYHLDTESHSFYGYYRELTKTESQLIIPILYGNTPMGLVTIDYPEKNVKTHEKEREILELITGQFAVALRNSHLYERSKKQSSHFQNLHLSALTLSKLYLDNQDEMMRMILLTASSFVDSHLNYLYEYIPENNNNSLYTVYKLVKNHSSGILKTEKYQESGWEEKKKTFLPDGYKGKMLSIRFSSENKAEYALEMHQESNFFTRDDFEVINAFVALSKITIDNTILYESFSSKKMFEREIEIAKEIQLNLLPGKFPDFPHYEFAGIMEAARGVGGDYYDFIVSPDKEEVVICIGDVSGKGVGAGMVMATVRTILHSLVRRKPTPRELLQDINTYLYYNYKDSSTPRFMTMTILSWMPGRDLFQFAGAGHGDILHFESSSQSIQKIPTNGIILGIRSNIDDKIYESQFTMGEGDSLLLYTDGITEAMDKKGNPFEEENLYKSFLASEKKSADSILSSILRDVKKFIGTREQHDDLTMVCIRKK